VLGYTGLGWAGLAGRAAPGKAGLGWAGGARDTSLSYRFLLFCVVFVVVLVVFEYLDLLLPFFLLPYWKGVILNLMRLIFSPPGICIPDTQGFPVLGPTCTWPPGIESAALSRSAA